MKKSNDTNTQFAKSKFYKQNVELIYHIDELIEHHRLCILASLVKDVLIIAHDNNHFKF